MTDIIRFYRDQYGVVVYYAGMNEHLSSANDWILNDNIDFSSKTTAVVPYPNSLKTTNDDSIVFAVVDIEYDADDRLTPLRHLGDTKINYFELDSQDVMVKMAHRLCENEGLVHKDPEGHMLGTYHVSTTAYDGFRWLIEGDRYDREMPRITYNQKFVGDIIECRKQIKSVEENIRGCFDTWKICKARPQGLTLGMVEAHLINIAHAVSTIDTKKRTQYNFDRSLKLIELAREEINLLKIREQNTLVNNDF